jgi:xanthine dehydrogenase iron-sulfur cluster and FAD-binding subunit A
VLLALDAVAVLRSRAGERRVPLHGFFLSYRRTALQAQEVLARVEVPPAPAGARTLAYKVSKRRELDISTVSAGFRVVLNDRNEVTRATLAYGGMAATPMRALDAEQALAGKPWTQPTVESVLPLIAQAFTPLNDHRGSAWYRSELAKNLLRGFFLETQAQAQPEPRLAFGHPATVQVAP